MISSCSGESSLRADSRKNTASSLLQKYMSRVWSRRGDLLSSRGSMLVNTQSPLAGDECRDRWASTVTVHSVGNLSELRKWTVSNATRSQSEC